MTVLLVWNLWNQTEDLQLNSYWKFLWILYAVCVSDLASSICSVKNETFSSDQSERLLLGLFINMPWHFCWGHKYCQLAGVVYLGLSSCAGGIQKLILFMHVTVGVQ